MRQPIRSHPKMTRFIAIDFVPTPAVEYPIRVLYGSGGKAGRMLHGNEHCLRRSPSTAGLGGRCLALIRRGHRLGRTAHFNPGF